MNKLSIILIALLLCACEPSAKYVHFPVVPNEFKDCKFARIENEQGLYLYVSRCPNSTTTTVNSDKAKTTTVVIDGVEYIKKE
jgi:hypothetical protein